ncbi:MAG: VWA domain-containing protein [Pirellulaceae bacterium]|jgi:hypothetical protein|nr:VWA domain-containing protein [Pirellulaceae bacterium]
MIPLLLSETRVIYQWLRVEQLDQWWHWLLLASVTLAIAVFVVAWYRRDSAEHHRAVGWALMLLRLAALTGLLLYFFQLDKRTEQRVVRDSRVAILVDTSLSMTLPGTPSVIGVNYNGSRTDEATELFSQSDILQRLSEQHQLSIYRFDQLSRPAIVGAMEKRSESDNSPLKVNSENDQAQLTRGRHTMLLATGVAILGLLCLLISLGAQLAGVRNWAVGSWLLLAGSIFALTALGISAIAIVPNSRYSLAAILGADLPPLVAGVTEISEEQAQELVSLPNNWSDALQPSGGETRLGDAIKAVLDRETGGPLAGIVVLTDGRNNAGIDPRQVVSTAQNMRVPLYIVGLGSELSPPNLQLLEVDLPKRLYPGDRFTLSALIGSSGFANQSVTVQITSGPKDAALDSLGIEAEQQIDIPADGSLATAQFELEPKAVGEWQYAARVLPLPNESDKRDNVQVTTIEVIERKNRVLIVAGGPTREYQFVRNLLYRDRDVESHVLLQSGSARSSQESQQLLTEFPADRMELSRYDAVLAFDVDWTQIPDRRVEALEKWVAEQAGGFLMVAGSVEMPKWIARSASGSRSTTLRSLSPVVLDQRGSSLLAAGRIESTSPWPLTITPDGRQTDFLWLSDDAQTSGELWKSFPGVHSFYAAYELKPGAKALALFSDPTAAVDGQQPIYLASQFYGAGRCVFLGGGELWRLRVLGDQYFDRFYTKLVRWISQGRLLMDSDRGVLLVDREQASLGEQVVVRAVLKDQRYEPLLQSEVVARLIDAQGRNLPLVLRPLADGSQPGVYTGQFPVQVPGEYSLQLQLGGLASDEVLTATVDAKVPAREMQHGQRNDGLLRQLAVDTGGNYWTGVAAAMLPDANDGLDLVGRIAPQDQVAFLPGATDPVFQLRWLGWLMAWIAGALSLEWLARRLHRLA